MKATTTICTQDAGPTILAALTGPHAPRALLVSLDRRGQLTHQALEAGQSVVDLHTLDDTQEATCSQASIIGAEFWTYPGAIGPDDLLMIDPYPNSMDTDGFYLLHRRCRDGRTVWKGCRYLFCSLTNGLMVDDGSGPVKAVNMMQFEVIGRIKRIYKSAPMSTGGVL